MSTATRRRHGRLDSKAWGAHVRAWQASGLSMAAYCRQRGLSYHAFDYWKKKLGQPQASAGLELVPVTIPLRPADVGAPIRIHLGDRFSLEVRDGFTPQTLQEVIAVLEGCR